MPDGPRVAAARAHVARMARSWHRVARRGWPRELAALVLYEEALAELSSALVSELEPVADECPGCGARHAGAQHGCSRR